MAKEPEFSPGTVSKILWHFTGGGKLNDKTQKRGPKKTDAAAFKALISILKSREIRLGSSTETVSMFNAQLMDIAFETGKRKIRKNVRTELSSAPVCCLCDIPSAHLGYHARLYGKFAIGFHRSAAVSHGFNPVLYSLEHTSIVHSICDPLSNLKNIDPQAIVRTVKEIGAAVREFNTEGEPEILKSLSKIMFEAEKIDLVVQHSRKALERLAAFVKTFQDHEFGTVYCEREWRGLKALNFDYDDVAMIVLPRGINRQYFEDFITKVVPKIELPRSIPIVPWEDLVEH